MEFDIGNINKSRKEICAICKENDLFIKKY